MGMGNYFFTTPEGDEAKVEYSFGYMLDEDGNVRINLHHSSMPYAPEDPETTPEAEDPETTPEAVVETMVDTGYGYGFGF